VGQSRREVYFQLPLDLQRDVTRFEEQNSATLRNIQIPLRLKEMLNEQILLSDADAGRLWEIYQQTELAGGDDIANGYRTRSAIAAALSSLAMSWLERSPDAFFAVSEQLRDLVLKIDWSDTAGRRSDIGAFFSGLDFAAYGIFALWLNTQEEPDEYRELSHRLLLSGDDGATAIISELAYSYRDKLEDEWWKLLRLGLFWSALAALSPDWTKDEGECRRWVRWRSKLLTWRPSGQALGTQELLDLWKRMGRIVAVRRRRRFREDSFKAGFETGPIPPLDEGVLSSLFGWVLKKNSDPTQSDLALAQKTLLMLWAYELQLLQQRRRDDGELPVSGQFVYDVVAQLAWIAARSESEGVGECWSSILSLGESGHYLVNHYISHWFIYASDGEAESFSQKWREMIALTLSEEAGSTSGGYRKREISRNMMGFGSEALLGRIPCINSVIEGLKDYYEVWAEKFLNHDGQDIRAFATFLSSDLGHSLRKSGLQRIADALKENKSVIQYRDYGVGEALVQLVEVTLSSPSHDLKNDVQTRGALITIASVLAQAKIAGALTLQERLKSIGR
jgi:hypothetical protein